MTQAAVQMNVRVNGQDEPLGVATLAALLEEKAVDTGQRGIAVALNGARHPGLTKQPALLAKTACCPTKDRGQGKEGPAVAICATLRAPRYQ